MNNTDNLWKLTIVNGIKGKIGDFDMSSCDLLSRFLDKNKFVFILYFREVQIYVKFRLVKSLNRKKFRKKVLFPFAYLSIRVIIGNIINIWTICNK